LNVSLSRMGVDNLDVVETGGNVILNFSEGASLAGVASFTRDVLNLTFNASNGQLVGEGVVSNQLLLLSNGTNLRMGQNASLELLQGTETRVQLFSNGLGSMRTLSHSELNVVGNVANLQTLNAAQINASSLISS
jgi:hypothetical protein